MKYAFLLIILLILGSQIFGQQPSYRFPDNNRIHDCQISLEGRQYLISDSAILVVNDFLDLESYVGDDCGNLKVTNIDFSENVLLLKHSGGDCHAWFVDEIVVDEISKVVRWKEYNHWGGCRAGGSWIRWVIVPKPPFGAKYVAEEILVDD